MTKSDMREGGHEEERKLKVTEGKKKKEVSKLPRRQRLKPGPIVTATAERSSSVIFALSRASCTTCTERQEEHVIHQRMLCECIIGMRESERRVFRRILFTNMQELQSSNKLSK